MGHYLRFATVAVDWLCVVNVAPSPHRCLCTTNPSEQAVQRMPAEPRLVRPCWQGSAASNPNLMVARTCVSWYAKPHTQVQKDQYMGKGEDKRYRHNQQCENNEVVYCAGHINRLKDDRWTWWPTTFTCPLVDTLAYTDSCNWNWGIRLIELSIKLGKGHQTGKKTPHVAHGIERYRAIVFHRNSPNCRWCVYAWRCACMATTTTLQTSCPKQYSRPKDE